MSLTVVVGNRMTGKTTYVKSVRREYDNIHDDIGRDDIKKLKLEPTTSTIITTLYIQDVPRAVRDSITCLVICGRTRTTHLDHLYMVVQNQMTREAFGSLYTTAQTTKNPLVIDVFPVQRKPLPINMNR
jgi:hypothetical protein